MKILNLILLLSIFLNISCKKDDFSIEKESYLENNLRIDGYYYHFNYDSTKISTLFFYENGVAITAFGQRPVNSFEKNLRSGEFYNSIKNDRIEWGLYSIENKNIKVEHLQGCGYITPCAYLYIGTILNDTTILFTEHNATEGSDDNKCNNLYHFKEFSPKPDSTNQFVK
jgi:hypothetical protein